MYPHYPVRRHVYRREYVFRTESEAERELREAVAQGTLNTLRWAGNVLQQALAGGTSQEAEPRPSEEAGQRESNGSPPAKPYLIGEMPLLQMQQKDLEDPVNRACPICLEEYSVGDSAMRMPCGHFYCEDCLQDWLLHHCSCPVCRYELPTDDKEFEKGRVKRMEHRRPRFRLHELERMEMPDLIELKLGPVECSGSVLRSSDLVRQLIDTRSIELIPEPEYKVPAIPARAEPISSTPCDDQDTTSSPCTFDLTASTPLAEQETETSHSLPSPKTIQVDTVYERDDEDGPAFATNQGCDSIPRAKNCFDQPESPTTVSPNPGIDTACYQTEDRPSPSTEQDPTPFEAKTPVTDKTFPASVKDVAKEVSQSVKDARNEVKQFWSTGTNNFRDGSKSLFQAVSQRHAALCDSLNGVFGADHHKALKKQRNSSST